MELTDIKQITDINEACRHYGELLGLERPVTENVLYAALEDEDYARNLLLARRTPPLLELLMLQAPAKKIKTPEAPGFSNVQLIGKAAKAFIDWGKTGFSTVTDEVYEKRMTACNGCDQLSSPPDQLVYKISLKKGEDKRTCNSCGCVVSRKARLVNDTCPLADEMNPGFNRWGEPKANAEVA